MLDVIHRNKALSVSPLKVSQTVGAALAFLGMQRSLPLMHGSQGCTAFAKVFFVRHFREPIPLQTTAMDQVSSVMGADGNVVEALRVICERHKPAMVGLVTTGLAETQGCDVQRALKEFRAQWPEYAATTVVAVNTPDFSGSFETGFALAVKAMVEALVPADREHVGLRPRQVNVLCSANLTPGDLEFITESMESFQLRPLLIPDLSGSLDGHLDDAFFNPLTTGGTSVADMQMVHESAATLVIGPSMNEAADLIKSKTGVPDTRFNHLMGLDAVDAWLMTLSAISQQAVPMRWQRQRQQLLDAMLDSHFTLSDARMALAGDADLLRGFNDLLRGIGARVVAAIVPVRSAMTHKDFMAGVGDLEDLEKLARGHRAELLIGNSHALPTAQRLHIPLLRAGFPQYDLMGGFYRCWSGYRGSQQALFDMANILAEQHHKSISPYRSMYAQKLELQSSGLPLQGSYGS